MRSQTTTGSTGRWFPSGYSRNPRFCSCFCFRFCFRPVVSRALRLLCTCNAPLHVCVCVCVCSLVPRPVRLPAPPHNTHMYILPKNSPRSHLDSKPPSAIFIPRLRSDFVFQMTHCSVTYTYMVSYMYIYSASVCAWSACLIRKFKMRENKECCTYIVHTCCKNVLH